jgi:hypothetical protein
MSPTWLPPVVASSSARVIKRTTDAGPSRPRATSVHAGSRRPPPHPLASADRCPYSILSLCAGPPTSSRVTIFTAALPPSTLDSSAGESLSAPPCTPVVGHLTPLRSPRRSPPSTATRISPTATLPVGHLTHTPLEAHRSAASAVYTSLVRTSPCTVSPPYCPCARVVAAQSHATVPKAAIGHGPAPPLSEKASREGERSA